MADSNLTPIIEDLVQQLVTAIEQTSVLRVQEAIAGAFGVPQKRGPGRPSAASRAIASVAVGRRMAAASPKLAQARRLQGQYLGALRALNEATKAKVKKVAKEKGVAEALKLAQSLRKAK